MGESLQRSPHQFRCVPYRPVGRCGQFRCVGGLSNLPGVVVEVTFAGTAFRHQRCGKSRNHRQCPLPFFVHHAVPEITGGLPSACLVNQDPASACRSGHVTCKPALAPGERPSFAAAVENCFQHTVAKIVAR